MTRPKGYPGDHEEFAGQEFGRNPNAHMGMGFSAHDYVGRYVPQGEQEKLGARIREWINDKVRRLRGGDC